MNFSDQRKYLYFFAPEKIVMFRAHKKIYKMLPKTEKKLTYLK